MHGRDERHGRLRSAATRANAFRNSNVAGYTLGCLLHPMVHKMHFCQILPSVPLRLISQNLFQRQLVGSRIHGHILKLCVVNAHARNHCGLILLLIARRDAFMFPPLCGDRGALRLVSGYR